MLTSANTSRTGRSVLEATVGEVIVHFKDQRLAGRVLASEGEEADLVMNEVDLATDQAVGPRLTQRPGHAQQGYFAVGAAAAQVNQSTRAARCLSRAATYLRECPRKSSRSLCSKRDQTLDCHQPL